MVIVLLFLDYLCVIVKQVGQVLGVGKVYELFKVVLKYIKYYYDKNVDILEKFDY